MCIDDLIINFYTVCPALADYSSGAIHDALELLVELAVVWPTMAKRWHDGLSHSVSLVPLRNEHHQVEGFGTAAEEDLDMDDKEGMYRHRYRENMETDGDREGVSPSTHNLVGGELSIEEPDT